MLLPIFTVVFVTILAIAAVATLRQREVINIHSARILWASIGVGAVLLGIFAWRVSTEFYYSLMTIPVVFTLLSGAIAIAALLSLRDCTLDDLNKAVWALIIVSAPVIGPIAFWIVAPQQSELAK